jgi:hypothetical protein
MVPVIIPMMAATARENTSVMTSPPDVPYTTVQPVAASTLACAVPAGWSVRATGPHPPQGPCGTGNRCPSDNDWPAIGRIDAVS